MKAPHYLVQQFAQMKVEAPYVIEGGHALKEFIEHLEKSAPTLIREAGFDSEQLEVAEAALAEMLQASNDAYQHRYARLHTSFGSMESRKNGDTGKSKLDRHDWQCIAETGIQRPEDKPVAASQRMGTAMGEAIAERSAETEGQLAQAVTLLAEGQRSTQESLRAMQEDAAEDRKLMLEILRERNGQGAGQ